MFYSSTPKEHSKIHYRWFNNAQLSLHQSSLGLDWMELHALGNMSAHHATSVHVGKPPCKYNMQEWARTSLHLHEFTGLPEERGVPVVSNRFTCVGHWWRLYLYVGGIHESEQRMVSVELVHMTGEHIKITLEISFGIQLLRGQFQCIPFSPPPVPTALTPCL
jgi:hypothetical protein